MQLLFFEKFSQFQVLSDKLIDFEPLSEENAAFRPLF